MAKAEISLEELGLDGGDGGKGALTAIPRTPPTYSNIELIAVGSIRIPPDRQRGDKINGRGEDESIKGLEDSFEAIGFFGAIIVSRDRLPSQEGGRQYKLIAGRRRLAACRSPHIPAQMVTLHADDDSPEATLEMIELFEDLRRLASALAVVGKLLDRNAAGPTRSSTHLYLVVLAPTGAGKSHQLELISTALMTAQLESVIGPGDLSSVQALQKLIVEKNSCLLMMDEFGSFLRRIKDAGQNSNTREITGEIRKLWDAWKRYDGVKKAHEDSVTVFAPALAIFGVTVAGDFYSALKIEDVSGGFLNRFLILQEKSRPKEKEPESWVGNVPFALMEQLLQVSRKYQSRLGKDVMDRKAADTSPGPVQPKSELKWGPGAQELYREFSASIRSEPDDKILELRIRAPEMAVRLATIRACGRLAETVDVDDMSWGIELARASADMLCAGVAEHMVPEGLDGLCEKITDFLRKSGGSASQREVYRSVRRQIKRSGDLEAAISYLTHRGGPTTR
jgi:hypothetical protein